MQNSHASQIKWSVLRLPQTVQIKVSSFWTNHSESTPILRSSSTLSFREETGANVITSVCQKNQSIKWNKWLQSVYGMLKTLCVKENWCRRQIPPFFPLKVAQNSLQYLDFDGCRIVTTLYHLMLQSWYQKTANQSISFFTEIISELQSNRINFLDIWNASG